jgi:hypothetical protein
MFSAARPASYDEAEKFNARSMSPQGCGLIDRNSFFLLPPDFENQIAADSRAATEFEEMLLTRRPDEIFAAEDETDWNEWVEFFSRTRETDSRRKGLVEMEL